MAGRYVLPLSLSLFLQRFIQGRIMIPPGPEAQATAGPRYIYLQYWATCSFVWYKKSGLILSSFWVLGWAKTTTQTYHTVDWGGEPPFPNHIDAFGVTIHRSDREAFGLSASAPRNLSYPNSRPPNRAFWIHACPRPLPVSFANFITLPAPLWA